MSSYLREVAAGRGLGMALLVRLTSWSNPVKTLFRRRFPRPAALAKVAYLLVLAVVISLLLAPERSHGQFRGIPSTPTLIPGFGFNTVFPYVSTGFTGLTSQSFKFSPFPAFPVGPYYGMPGIPFQFPLFNFPASTSFFNPFLAGFGGFTGLSSISFGMIGSPFGFQGFASIGSGSSGFSGFNSSVGLNGFGLSGFGGMGGFAGKGFGGFNGRKPL
ncbi:MAG TPA: hypothetical protein VMG10_20350 [Gemmataceae bacterium]|nr:hypothetical protein [Gemmataceae bacterium]